MNETEAKVAGKIVLKLLKERDSLDSKIKDLDSTLRNYQTFAEFSTVFGQVVQVHSTYEDAIKSAKENNESLDRDEEKWERGLSSVAPYQWKFPLYLSYFPDASADSVMARNFVHSDFWVRYDSDNENRSRFGLHEHAFNDPRIETP